MKNRRGEVFGRMNRTFFTEDLLCARYPMSVDPRALVMRKSGADVSRRPAIYSYFETHRGS